MNWFAYECHNAGCASEGTGVILDLRYEGTHPVGVVCPLCGGLLTFESFWAATEAGYGSRSDESSKINELLAVIRDAADWIEGSDTTHEQYVPGHSYKWVCDSCQSWKACKPDCSKQLLIARLKLLAST